jgi:hypothetical protein
MGLLDQLAQEVARVQQQKDQEEQRDDAQEKRRAQVLNARLRATYAYFEKFKEHVDILAPKLETSYDVRGLCTLKGLLQTEYALSSDDVHERMTSFTFRCLYRGTDPVQATISHGAMAESIKDYLEQHRLKFKLVTRSGKGNVFTVQPEVPMSFEFSSEPETEMIRLVLRNVNGLSRETYHYPVSKLDREFVDEIAKCVLHKPNRLTELTGNNLTDTTRFRIRTAVEESKRHQTKDEGLSGPTAASLFKGKAKSSVSSLTRRFGLRKLMGQKSA